MAFLLFIPLQNVGDLYAPPCISEALPPLPLDPCIVGREQVTVTALSPAKCRSCPNEDSCTHSHFIIICHNTCRAPVTSDTLCLPHIISRVHREM